MPETIHLSDLCKHTITKIFKHDPKSELGLMIKQWVIFNRLENLSSLLNYTALRQWVNHQGIENFQDLLSWDEDEIKTQPVQQIFSLDDKGQGSHLRTNQLMILHHLAIYDISKKKVKSCIKCFARISQPQMVYTTSH